MVWYERGAIMSDFLPSGSSWAELHHGIIRPHTSIHYYTSIIPHHTISYQTTPHHTTANHSTPQHTTVCPLSYLPTWSTQGNVISSCRGNTQCYPQCGFHTLASWWENTDETKIHKLYRQTSWYFNTIHLGRCPTWLHKESWVKVKLGP